MGGWTGRMAGWFSLLSLLVCLPAQANPGAHPHSAPVLLAQNDLLLSAPVVPEVTGGAAPPSAASSPSPVSTEPGAIASTGSPGLRMVLLLPGRSATFRSAAQAVQEGFRLAAEREPDPRVTFTVVETSEDPSEVLSAYQAAQARAELVIGPLTRSGVTALAQRAQINKPTLALAQPEQQNEGEIRLPPRMLSIGLSIEDEARQAARQAVTDGHLGRAYILSAGAAWQRRAARAFADEWRRQRQVSESMEITASGPWLDINGLQQLKRRLEAEQPVLIFVALNAEQASQVREAIGAQLPMVGTSQLNPLPAGDWPVAARKPELNGVQLLDMPWLIQPQHPAVMAWRTGLPPSTRGADLERLFALGIDAWRIAREIAAYRSGFELDGVTGRLQVEFGAGQSRVQRSATQAEYRDGMVVPLER